MIAVLGSAVYGKSKIKLLFVNNLGVRITNLTKIQIKNCRAILSALTISRFFQHSGNENGANLSEEPHSHISKICSLKI
jgi:hypothetical protein